MNFILLNQVTELLQYPIPRYDYAVGMSFGDGKWYWLLDCPQGYHQILVAEDSRDKLAFAGPNATVWRFRVMPFGPVNGPPIFIRFMHDMNYDWQTLAIENEVPINDDNNTKMVVDEILSHATTVDIVLDYMECHSRYVPCRGCH